jgi:hypothetical protein
LTNSAAGQHRRLAVIYRPTFDVSDSNDSKGSAMSMTAEKKYGDLGETRGIEDHDQHLICDLSLRLDCMGRYDQYIANAGGRPALQEFWRGAKSREQLNIDQLKKLIEQYVLTPRHNS